MSRVVLAVGVPCAVKLVGDVTVLGALAERAATKIALVAVSSAMCGLGLGCDCCSVGVDRI